MMETLALSSADNQNNQTLHVAAAAGVLDNHHHSPVEEEQMMNLSDMTDLSQEIQEDMVVTMPVAKEILLISLVSQEQALYNPKHENYRNTHRKDIKWLEISEQLGWTELQCKAKWKAMRDQYCRELKRSKFNNKVNVKWKYFKELDFLRPYALARNYRPRLPPAINTNNNNNNNNNNNSFICSTITNNNNGITNVANEDNNVTPKFTTIKIEGSTTINFATCDFSSAKSDTSNNLTEEQLSSVLQQQNDEHNWTYITGSNNSSNNNTRLDNHSLSDTQHLLNTHHQHNTDNQHHQTQTTDEALYNVLVDCMGQIQEQQQQQQQQQQEQLCQQQTTPNNNEDEDDDPIHTFLNIESYFEKELIGLIRNEDMLYNNFNPNYRNVKLKLEAWDEIARKLKKTVKQCRLKWKALRDQFIREHKRLKSRENSETLPRWKHYDALSFLQKFIKHKGSDYITPKNLLELAKNKLVDDMDDGSSSPLQQITDDQGMQQPNEHQDNLCVSTGSVGGYDDMDIDNYIIGDSGSVVDDHNEADDHDPDNEDRKSQQEFSVFSNHNTNISMGSTAMDSSNNTIQQTFKEEHPQLQTQHLTEVQQQQQQQHISMPSLDLNDATTPNDLLNSNTISNNNNPPTATNQNNYQNPLNNSNNITLASTVQSLDMCSGSLQLTAASKPPPLQPAPTTTEASTNTPSSNQQQPDNNNYSISNNHQLQATSVANNLAAPPPPPEEDEVGAFFKSVAMKIRNANLSQVALTDLEIDILRVINNALRNH